MAKRRNVILSEDEDEEPAPAPPPPPPRKAPAPARPAASRAPPPTATADDEDFLDDDQDDIGRERGIARSRDKGKGRAIDDDEDGPMLPPANGASAAARKRKHQAANQDGSYAWEAEYSRSWDVVREDEEGSLASALNEFVERAKRRRTTRDTSSIQRGIIRHLYLVLDLSHSMLERDMRPSRLELTLQYARAFIGEFFDQNPISQVAIIGTRNGIAERISPLSSNPTDHEQALKSRSKLEPSGEPSLQNALEMARLGMSHLPEHGSREVLVIFSSLTTCDPTNIHHTIDSLVKDRVRVNIVGLSAEISVCREICSKTKGNFAVAIDETHYKELLFEVVPPPATESGGQTLGGGAGTSAGGPKADLMLMGFPVQLTTRLPGLCACHHRLRTSGYICPRCRSRLCEIPTECPVCTLSVVSSPHLARSYRHLFPVQNYSEVNGPVADPESLKPGCFGCATPFPSEAWVEGGPEPPSGVGNARSTSANARYECPKCHSHFCVECELFIHDALSLCPGCG